MSIRDRLSGNEAIATAMRLSTLPSMWLTAK